MFRRLLAALGALLVLFHAWLFAGQVWSGELADAALLARWAAAGGLALALAWLRRRGIPLFRGRQAVAIWLLAALLHAPALADRLETAGPAVPEAVAAFAPLAAAALLAGLIWISGLFAAAPAAPPNTRRRSDDIEPACRLTPASFLVLAPRPPPLH